MKWLFRIFACLFVLAIYFMIGGNVRQTSREESESQASAEDQDSVEKQDAAGQQDVSGTQDSAGRQDASETAVYRKITAEEAKQKMEEATLYILVDVRSMDEYKQAHIEGAILIPDYEIADSAETQLPDKEALILVYCRSGARSARASEILVGMGYANVYDFGGIMSWPYPTISE